MEKLCIICCFLLTACGQPSKIVNTEQEVAFLLKEQCKSFVLDSAKKNGFLVKFKPLENNHDLYQKVNIVGFLKYEYYNKALDYLDNVNSECFGNEFIKIPEHELQRTGMQILLQNGKEPEGVRYNNGSLEVYVKKPLIKTRAKGSSSN